MRMWKSAGVMLIQILYILKKGTKILIEEGKPKLKLTIKNVKKMTREEREEVPLCYYNIINKINEEEENKLTVENTRKKLRCGISAGRRGLARLKWL